MEKNMFDESIQIRGARKVKEYDPNSDEYTEWIECYDLNGEICRIQLKYLNGVILNEPHHPAMPEDFLFQPDNDPDWLKMLNWDKKKDDIGFELKKLIKKKKDLYWIGRWASNLIYKYSTDEVYSTKEFDFSEKFEFTYDILAKLEFLCEGESFAISYEELDQLADELILARDIELK